ncbi:hypothetical protein DFH07DRAFT_896075 [Mycena maculata]|uniref:Uncharacterized protein n=1 Tax=Mycena maculata TaxID=230809 RepID=A0AAD7HTT0_9AGAR|nr:hypothetical protein DFH07DRAFT_896075 [Mycena maculata]
MEGSSALPKTTHALNHRDRVRLIRSTRKVEALLGETPLFIDPSSPRNSASPVPNARRPAFIYVAKPRSSSLGVYIPDSPHASTSRAPARPLLAVRVPLRADVDSPLESATSLSFPTYPAAPADEERRQRTRKMARIMRTLGENVPTELVFPATPTRTRRTSTLSKRRSNRLVRASSSAARSAAQERLVEADEGDEPTVADSDSDSVSVYSTLSGGDWLQVPKPQTTSAPAGSSSIGRDRGTHRTEKGWSGEWVAAGGNNMQNMDDVARQLRDLRLR